jgi:cell division septal protein FtsQ
VKGIKRRIRRRLFVIGTAAVLGLGAPIWAPPALSTLPLFRVERVSVSGTRFVSEDEVLRLAAIDPQASVWDDGTEWEARIRTHRLVREARVHRAGIRVIEIRVTEVEPLAFVAGRTLVPVDGEGWELPLDPAAHSLSLPVLGGEARVEGGRVMGVGAIDALVALAQLKEYDAAFFDQISEVRPIGAKSVQIELIESGRTGRVLLRTTDAVSGLRLVELALGHAADRPVATADARFNGLVILSTRNEG